IVYADGTILHAWHGAPMPADLAGRAADIELAEIRNENNAERRRIMMEMYGVDRYVRDLGAKLVAEDRFGRLWRCEAEGEPEPIQVVEVQNATREPDGTSKVYFLRVPPSIRTARGAVAWTFGLHERSYDPDRES